ncbi:hypothetical protein [Geothrix edaphica]|nr:hypothetical protein [Geothrix edaphica]
MLPRRWLPTARGFEGGPYDIEVGQQQRLREFKLDDPAVQAKLRERYGAQIPLDEPVISPAAMFNSGLLQVVAQE